MTNLVQVSDLPSTSSVQKALTDIRSIGFTPIGVNFTGGEIFLPGSNLPELLETAQSLKIDVRVNTNGWWGNQVNIGVGSLRFPSASHVVGWLRDLDVSILALSFDQRYEKNSALLDSVISAIKVCEQQGQHYQIICTDVTDSEIAEGWRRLTEDNGINPRLLIPVEMDMIDIGGAAQNTKKLFESRDSTQCLTCDGKGFYRPYYLHVNPDGGVRSCLYAIDAGWLGNVNHESLLQIEDGFTENRVVTAFTSNEIDLLYDSYLTPITQDYRLPMHPCAKSAIVAAIIEQCNRFEDQEKRKPQFHELRSIYKSIAGVYNLQK